jgi:DNA-directed RNA polymerase subunit RPC12/RpoP
MSTIEFTCPTCSKTFRVRSEFAGRTTRCPGCSHSITIGSTAPKATPAAAVPPPLTKVTRPIASDEEPSYYGNWKPALTALKREQTAVLFVGIQLLVSLFGLCIGSQMIESMQVASLVGFVFLLPGIIATVLSLIARITALRVPKVSGLRTGAIAGLLCILGGVISLLMFILTLGSSFSHTGQGSSGEEMRIAFFGFAGAGLAAIVIFAIYVALLGIHFRAEEIGKQIGSMAFTVGSCLLVIAVVGGLLGLLIDFFGSGLPYYFLAPVVVGVVVIAGIILAFQYHRLLGLAHQVIREKTGATRDS